MVIFSSRMWMFWSLRGFSCSFSRKFHINFTNLRQDVSCLVCLPSSLPMNALQSIYNLMTQFCSNTKVFVSHLMLTGGGFEISFGGSNNFSFLPYALTPARKKVIVRKSGPYSGCIVSLRIGVFFCDCQKLFEVRECDDERIASICNLSFLFGFRHDNKVQE